MVVVLCSCGLPDRHSMEPRVYFFDILFIFLFFSFSSLPFSLNLLSAVDLAEIWPIGPGVFPDQPHYVIPLSPFCSRSRRTLSKTYFLTMAVFLDFYSGLTTFCNPFQNIPFPRVFQPTFRRSPFAGGVIRWGAPCVSVICSR